MRIPHSYYSQALLLPALLTGCSFQVGGDDPTPSYVVQTPTPAATATPTEAAAPTPTSIPTPVPTPTALPPSGYRVSSWVLSGEAGVDLDADGAVDNGYLSVYQASVEVIAAEVFRSSYETLAAGGMPIEQARLIAMQLSETVLSYYSVENFNAQVGRALTGQYFNLLQLLEDTGGATALDWYSGVSLELGTYGAEAALGRQPGAINGGRAVFGPAELRLDFAQVYGSPGESDLLTLAGEPVLTLDGAVSRFVEGASGFSDGQLGGRLQEATVVDYVAALVPSKVCSPSGAACVAFDIEQPVLEELAVVFDELEAIGVWTVAPDGSRSVAVGFAWEADYVPVLTSW